ncbi:MAG: EamA family transporter [Burkholderiaceae bacterium]|nr:EamA family transporter [Burkholderiaceae bacterium]
MSTAVLAVVLFSALLHAGWNAAVRASGDKLLASWQVVCGATLLSLPLLVWLPLPAPASWPWLLASGLIHVFYFVLVARAYQGAELGLAYPLMRGTAPVLTAAVAALWLHETPTPLGALGIALICAGVLVLAGRAWRQGLQHPGAAGAALANAAVIALYTLVDGQGVRLAGHALAYTAWLFTLTAAFMGPALLWWRGRSALRPAAGAWRVLLLGGAGTLGAYSLVLWAMTRAPIASVAALRETSIVFAALIGALLLKEGLGRLQLASALLVCAGAVLLRVG